MQASIGSEFGWALGSFLLCCALVRPRFPLTYLQITIARRIRFSSMEQTHPSEVLGDGHVQQRVGYQIIDSCQPDRYPVVGETRTLDSNVLELAFPHRTGERKWNQRRFIVNLTGDVAYDPFQ